MSSDHYAVSNVRRQQDTVPVSRIIERVDACFNKNDLAEAGRLLEYWRDEAVALGDLRGEYAMLSELVGYYRKTDDREKAIPAIERALLLTDMLSQGDTVSGATVLLNCATTKKAFGFPEEAMPLYEQALAVYRARLPEGDARFGGLYNNMALALADLGRYREAENFYLSAIEANGEEGAAESAITYVNLAHMYEESGEICKIKPCLENAKALLFSPALPHNGYFAFVLSKCAPSFKYFGMDSLADGLMKMADQMFENK